ncbi:MAG TPA: hypothetical protein VGB03_01645 [Acidimicrobiales bacterium]|jgi:hypothetical protein
MESRRWLNTSQTQTLQIAVFLLYIHAGVLVLSGALFTTLWLLVAVAMVAAGYGVANEQKWGYSLAVGVSLVPFAIILLFGGLRALFAANPVSIMFDVALVALLVHPQSRDYQRIWFK